MGHETTVEYPEISHTKQPLYTITLKASTMNIFICFQKNITMIVHYILLTTA